MKKKHFDKSRPYGDLLHLLPIFLPYRVKVKNHLSVICSQPQVSFNINTYSYVPKWSKRQHISTFKNTLTFFENENSPRQVTVQL